MGRKRFNVRKPEAADLEKRDAAAATREARRRSRNCAQQGCERVTPGKPATEEETRGCVERGRRMALRNGRGPRSSRTVS